MIVSMPSHIQAQPCKPTWTRQEAKLGGWSKVKVPLKVNGKLQGWFTVEYKCDGLPSL